MKFSESWLREWVNPNLKTEELVEQVTMAGLEVDGLILLRVSLAVLWLRKWLVVNSTLMRIN